MISNERKENRHLDERHPMPPLSQPTPTQDSYRDRPRDNAVATETIQVERKTITLAICQNDRGRFMRVTEACAGRYNHIVIPETGWAAFKEVMERVVANGSR